MGQGPGCVWGCAGLGQLGRGRCPLQAAITDAPHWADPNPQTAFLPTAFKRARKAAPAGRGEAGKGVPREAVDLKRQDKNAEPSEPLQTSCLKGALLWHLPCVWSSGLGSPQGVDGAFGLRGGSGPPALPQATRCAGEGSAEDRFSDPAGPAWLRDAGDLQVYKPETIWDPGVSTCTAVCGCTQAARATFLLQAPTSGPGLGPPPSCSQARSHGGAGVPVSAAGVQAADTDADLLVVSKEVSGRGCGAAGSSRRCPGLGAGAVRRASLTPRASPRRKHRSRLRRWRCDCACLSKLIRLCPQKEDFHRM